MSFAVQGLKPELFADLAGADDATLAAYGVSRHIVTAKPDAPCRITLEDAEIGETVLLLSYEHQDGDSPYRQQGPIFVRESAKHAFGEVDAIPSAFLPRTLSLRGFNTSHAMIEADLVEGKEASALIERFFANPDVAYIHAHYAKRGCFAARIDRA